MMSYVSRKKKKKIILRKIRKLQNVDLSAVECTKTCFEMGDRETDLNDLF